MEAFHNRLARDKEDEEVSYLPDSFESEEQREVWIKRGHAALDTAIRLVKKYEAILDDERKEVEKIRSDIETMKQLPIKPVIKLKE